MEKIVGHLFRICGCHGTKITKLENPSCTIWVFDEAVGPFPMGIVLGILEGRMYTAPAASPSLISRWSAPPAAI